MNELEIKDLKKSFSDFVVFKNLSFNLEKGKILAIIGGSGSGKSTLIQCISFLELADSGHIKLGETSINLAGSSKNEEIKNLIYDLRSKIGVVFQDFNLWPHMSVLKNLIEAPIQVNKEKKKKAKGRAMKILKELGLEKKANEMPNNLSGGQKQRVAIARALMMDPEIMLFDEPTSALDPNKVNVVINIIKELSKKDITIIISTHEINFAKEIADKVIYIGNKKIIEMGDKDILDNPKTEALRQFLNL